MQTTIVNETMQRLAAMLELKAEQLSPAIHRMAENDHRYLKDLRINLANVMQYATLTRKESYLLCLAVALNHRSSLLVHSFETLAHNAGATKTELDETAACVSLMNVNNVFYRFRHFTGKEFYQNTPAGIKMSVMLDPTMGKELFELMSLVISALNGCEQCVRSHESSLTGMQCSEQKIYDAVRLGAVIRGFAVIS